MSPTFAIVIRVAIIFGVALYMWSVSCSLEQIARDLRRIADHSGPKPPVEGSDRLIDASQAAEPNP
jgi:hypothetical protein